MGPSTNPDTFDPKHLGEHLRNVFADEGRPNVTFLLGAGFSRTAGVPLAAEIANELRDSRHPLLRQLAGPPEGVSEYAFLMERLGSPQERAKCVKRFVNRSIDPTTQKFKLNWAHLLLAAMVRAGYIYRVLTTNFDPLALEALAGAGLPLRTFDLCATGKYNPNTLDPGTIVYLHGQMHSLFLANAPGEMERVRQLYPIVLQEAINDSFVIVVGYSGDYDPVLESLRSLVSFPRGLWWSHYGKEKVGLGVQKLFSVHGSDCHLRTGDDADTFMRRLVLDGMQLELPVEVIKPITAMRSNLERYTSFPTVDYPGNDPVPTAIELLTMLEAVQDRKPESSSIALGTDELLQLTKIQMAALNGDAKKVEQVARLIPPDGASRVSLNIGDAYCQIAEKDYLEGRLSDSLNNVGKAHVYGVTEKWAPWLAVLHGNILRAQKSGQDQETDAWYLRGAIRQFKIALSRDPDHYQAVNNVGLALMELSQLTTSNLEAERYLNDAKKWFIKASELMPEKTAPLRNGALCMGSLARLIADTNQAQEMFDDAIGMIEKCLSINTDNYKAWHDWGTLLIDRAVKGRFLVDADRWLTEAIVKFSESLKRHPAYFESFQNWARILKHWGIGSANEKMIIILDELANAEFTDAAKAHSLKHDGFFYLACSASIQKKTSSTVVAINLWLLFGREPSKSKIDAEPDLEYFRETNEYVRLMQQWIETIGE